MSNFTQDIIYKRKNEMAGIYIHIPFCKQACSYCNFHFSTSLKNKKPLIAAICEEIKLRKDFLGQTELETIYFGGGTPSLLDEEDLNMIFNELLRFYTWKVGIEITLEANPDDIDAQKVALFRKYNINRLSIGIQSFFEEDLVFMHRAHNSLQAERCIQIALDGGIDRISADLIYGAPTTTNEMWEKNIEKMISFDIGHISSYCLTVEDKTQLGHLVKTQKIKPMDEKKAEEQFLILMNRLHTAQFDHYEISNFAKEGQLAVHNTNYWRLKPYLGLGPAAHSYRQNERSWNIANNAQYIKLLNENQLPTTFEKLEQNEHYNEYIMTSLRTKWGVDIDKIKQYGSKYLIAFEDIAQKYINQGDIYVSQGNYTLTQQGKLFADRIAMDLFIVD